MRKTWWVEPRFRSVIVISSFVARMCDCCGGASGVFLVEWSSRGSVGFVDGRYDAGAGRRLSPQVRWHRLVASRTARCRRGGSSGRWRSMSGLGWWQGTNA